jgi:hypothetical protein
MEDQMSTQAAQWFSSISEKERQFILGEYGIRPGTTLGRECFSYGLVNTNLPAFAARVVESAYSQLPTGDAE